MILWRSESCFRAPIGACFEWCRLYVYDGDEVIEVQRGCVNIILSSVVVSYKTSDNSRSDLFTIFFSLVKTFISEILLKIIGKGISMAGLSFAH